MLKIDHCLKDQQSDCLNFLRNESNDQADGKIIQLNLICCRNKMFSLNIGAMCTAFVVFTNSKS